MKHLVFTSIMALFLFSCRESKIAEPNKLPDNTINSYLAKQFPKSEVLVNKIYYSRTKELSISEVIYSVDGEPANITIVQGTGKIIAGGKSYSIENSKVSIVCNGTCTGTTTKCQVQTEVGQQPPVFECTCEGCTMTVTQV